MRLRARRNREENHKKNSQSSEGIPFDRRKSQQSQGEYDTLVIPTTRRNIHYRKHTNNDGYIQNANDARPSAKYFGAFGAFSAARQYYHGSCK